MLKIKNSIKKPSQKHYKIIIKKDKLMKRVFCVLLIIYNYKFGKYNRFSKMLIFKIEVLLTVWNGQISMKYL